MRWKPIAIMGGLGLSLLLLGAYLAPYDAYALQRPFRELGEATTGIVVDKHVATVEYEAGGQDARTRSYRERSLRVRIDREAGREVDVQHLVLKDDYERLSEGDEVAITFVRGEQARAALPTGPYYMLTRSVEAGTLELLPWAFDGRPASGKAIAAGIPGLVLTMIALAMLYDGRRRKPG